MTVTGHLRTGAPTASHDRLALGLAALVAALVVVVVLSILVGSNPFSPAEVWAALHREGDAFTEQVVWDLRLPRTFAALLVGAALGVAGAVMQSLTRNPLADPGILGVNAGAAVAVSFGLVLGLAGTVGLMAWWSMAGAAVATVVVYGLGSVGGGTTPVRLALAGTAVAAVLVGITSSLSVSFPGAFDVFRFWAVGSFEGRGWDVLTGTAPFIAVGLALAIALGSGLDSLALGDDNARALGVQVGATRAAAGLATTLLCGAAVAAAGPIGFVGLTVPHVVRSFSGRDTRRLLPVCALGGAVLVLTADVLGRVVARPGELEAGIVTALIGGPVFVAIVRRRGAVALVSGSIGRIARVRTWTLVYDGRALVVTLAIVAAAAVLLLLDLATGRLGLGVGDVWQTLQGRGSPTEEYAVYELRMPRALTAVLVGLALGAAGSAFQSLTRNPLGSPDVIGFTAGAATGALVGVLALHGSQLTVAAASVAGGLGTAAIVYYLARQDGVHGYRLVLLGIGISAVLMSVNAYLITRAELADALAAQVWLTGTLTARGWEHVVPLAVVVVVVLPALVVLGRSLSLWSLGSDTAGSLGVRLERLRLLVVVAGVLLVSAATTATGPIAFVALTAPHVARLLTRGAQPGIVSSAVTGAALLVAADLATQRLSGGSLPVGVVTSLLGGGYLAVLLAREWKAGRG